MFKKFLIMAAMSTIGVSAYAFDTTDIQKSVKLTDGSTVHVFKDGRMAMEDKYGRAASMKQGQVMEAADGQKITMQGNEVARLESAVRDHQYP